MNAGQSWEQVMLLEAIAVPAQVPQTLTVGLPGRRTELPSGNTRGALRLGLRANNNNNNNNNKIQLG